MTAPKGNYRDPARREHFVYRLFDRSGRLLYVGCTMRPEARWREHQFDKRWIRQVASVRMQGPFNYDTARAMERQALQTEEPRYSMTPQKQAAKNRRIARRVATRKVRKGDVAAIA